MVGSKSWRNAEFALPAASQQVLQTLSAFLDARRLPGDRLCVGLSGGRDSVVLLHALAALRGFGLAVDLSAVHVNHGLSAIADTWAAFCDTLCTALGIPLAVVRVEVPRVGCGEGLEAAARRSRHAVFAGCDADWLALAHHRDDQAETILFRLLRGAGVGGAAGMPAERPQAGGPRLIRPLLDLPRSLLAAYAEENALRWVEDESNADSRHRRNHLRRQVMPRIEERFPGAAQVLARAGRHFAEAALLLEELAKIDRAAAVGVQGRIDLARFKVLSKARAGNLLRSELLAAGFQAPEARWLEEALRQLATVGTGSETCVATRDGEIHAYRGELHVVRHRPPVVDGPVPWRGEASLPWGGDQVMLRSTQGIGISYRLLRGAPVCLRRRLGGERIQPDPRRPLRSLRKLLQEAGVPPWDRARLPLLWSGERLVWVAGIGIDAAFACAPEEPGVMPVWETAPQHTA
jgi:tRNA(Ile)-lysidine synthase